MDGLVRDISAQHSEERTRKSVGEIVSTVARRSDAYHDVALHYAILAMLLVPAWWALVSLAMRLTPRFLFKRIAPA